MAATSIVTNCQAQIILNKPVNVAIGKVNFNPITIKKNKIASISIAISEKPDGEIINTKGAEIIYRFNDNGYLRRYTYSVLNKSKTDFIQNAAITKTQYIYDKVNVYMFYNLQNRPIAKRTRIGDFFHTYYYEYYPNGKIRKQYHCNETNISDNSSTFKLGKQDIVSYNIFEYIKLTSTQIKKNYLNDNLDVYKKGIINYDSKGSMLSESSEFIVSCKRKENLYEYDINNNLIKQTLQSNHKGETEKESMFEYSIKGNLLSEKKYIDGVLHNEIQYLYDKEKNMIHAEIDRDHIKATVIIKRYRYEFYEN